MAKGLHRKTFLQKLGAGLASMFTLPILADTKNETGQPTENKMNTGPTLFKIQEMGFQWETADPFLFCVHHEDKFPKGNEQMGPAVPLSGRHLGDDFIIKDGFRMYHGKQVAGFPGHPHRGFETVTVVREGIVDHADSLGAAGRYGNGDVQWMTAGKGVQHSEMFPCIHKDKENPMELFQIWLNLPAKMKMVNPHFKMLWADSIPKYKHKDSLGKVTEVEVIAGKLDKYSAPAPPPDSWAAKPSNEVAIWNIRMEQGATWKMPKASPGINRSIYYYQGNGLQIEGQIIPGYHSLQAKSDVELYLKNGKEEARILVLQGRPIGEPVIQYGPFVMNSKEEIHQAFDDYHKTQFGGWPWPKAAQVHDRKLGRFALHADGRREEKA
jgi:redox-sensitive bicupin YhaK (pirin superfamily)